MKSYLLLFGFGLLAASAACDTEASPAAPAPRAVVGTVETKIGDVVQRYDLRVDRLSGAFLPVLRPRGQPGGGILAARLAQFPFVRDSVTGGGPFVVETPHGTLTTALTYRALGPWQVLDRATTTMRIRTPTGERRVDFAVALLDARLER